jgi:hypothetical protein
MRLLEHPLPVISAGQGLLAFVSSGSIVYLWDGQSASPVYEGFGIRGLGLSPDPARPYLAIIETTIGPAVPAFRDPDLVTVVNLQTRAYYRALSPDAGSPAHGTPRALQWSADGLELLVEADPPVVLAIGADAATLAWDLADVVPEGAEMRRPLMAPDFSRLAVSLFEAEPGVGEDLWIANRPAASASASPDGLTLRRRLTSGNRGGYPVLWLGGRSDGSDPAGVQTYVLAELGAVSTGGGTPTGLAVVNADTGTMEIWYAEGGMVHRPALVDLARGRALIGVYHPVTGQGGRTVWHALRGGASDTGIPTLGGYQLTGSAVGLEDGSAVVMARDPETTGDECWLVGIDGSARKLGSAGQGERMHLINGTIGGRAYVLSVAADAGGADRCKLNRVIAEEGRLEPVELIAAAPK